MIRKKLIEKCKRPSYGIWALVMLVTIAIPVLSASSVKAYGLLATRSITMSNSSSGATTAGQNVIYKFDFTTVTAANIGSIAIEFCENNPIIEDNCTITGADTPSTPFGFNTNYATLAFNGAQSGITDLSVDTTNSTANRLVLKRPSAQLVNAGTHISFTLGDGTTNGFTNAIDTDPLSGPTHDGAQLGSFYGRISTFTNLDASGPRAGNGARVDAGGIALATTTSVDITSKVQERLQFCVYSGANCGSGVTPIKLGNDNGVLDPNQAFVDTTTKYDILTNASQGADVRIKGGTLKTGGFTIDPAGNPSGDNVTPSASIPGSEQFGLCNYLKSGTSIGLLPKPPYDNANCNATTQTSGNAVGGGDGGAQFGFSQDPNLGTTSTFGSIIAHKNPGQTSTGVVPFIGNISLTTEAGVYTTTLNFIATGIY